MRAIVICSFTLLLISCWKQQDIPVAPPDYPSYLLFGTLTWEDTEPPIPIRGATIRVTMTEVYQGEFLDPIEVETDSLGKYEIQGLYRARYTVRVTRGLEWLYDGEVGIIQYEDKEYSLSLPSP